ncbi:copper amine oxidase N-terminal domain-containing protein [Lachnospiraceae bacterium NSJ-143]|nr:copper amine oxidase N-terminal domain-containing protein [Lachnospiraceae bacterium NSJ-143]
MKKIFLTVMLICTMAFSTVATAYAGVKVQAGTRQVQADDILVKEAAPGALKKGKNIYLRCKYVSFEDGITYELVSGDAKIEKVTSEDGLITIKIKSESNKEPAVIRLSNVKMYLDGSLAEGDYPLELITEESDKFPDNAFGQSYDSESSGFDDKFIVFDESFFTVEGSANMANASDNDTAGISEISVGTGEENESGSYINESSYVMLPVRFISEALNDSAVVSWDDTTKTVNIMMGQRTMAFTVGKSTMNVNGNDIPLVTPMEIKDERAFLSLRDLGYAMGISEDKIYWDDETKTAYLNYKGE